MNHRTRGVRFPSKRALEIKKIVRAKGDMIEEVTKIIKSVEK